MSRLGLACAALSLLGMTAAPSIAALQQDTVPPAQDTLRRVPDTIPSFAPQPVRDAEVPLGPLAPGTRISFTRDSLVWTSAFTLGDLLQRVPGVYLARAGYLGLPEYVQYGGRGGSALEIYWDGLPLLPLGQDSLFLDPGRIRLNYLERVDIEVWPARIRVHLVSERYPGADPASKVRVASGPFETGAYAGLFQRRWPNGIGLALAADFLGTDGASGPGRSDQLFDVWAKLSWLPTPRAGMTYQIRRQDQERPPVTVGAGTGVPELKGNRSEFLFTLFSETASERDALRLDGGVAVSKWTPDSGFAVPVQEIRQAYAAVAYRRPSLSTRVEGRLGDRRTLAGLAGRAGWVPFPGLVVSGDAEWQRHEGDRESRSVHAAAGIYAGPFSLIGDIAVRDGPQAPAVLSDTAVFTRDRRVRLSADTRPLSASVSLVERDAFDALAYPALGVIHALPSVPRTTYLVSEVRLRSSSALSLGAWYSDPVTDTTLAGLQPPSHARVDITLRSKFWRTFRSGAFDLMVQLAMESWSTGTAGLDPSGAPIVLPGATFYHLYVQFQIVGFIAFYEFRNARLTTAQYVPGLPYPRQAQAFGVTWEFLN